MSTALVTVILFGGLICLLTLGVPVVFALASISILVAYILGGANDLFIVATTTYRQITEYSLMSIPLFLLMGNFLLHSGISDRLFKALNYWLAGVRGGLAIVSVGVCVALAM
ncbi:MAG TPA: TRAP transporter large permease subunit, partial [Desulfobacterales bacterium]|nr:TRAP transporter large permease subunit [Desulfobacterales bacterium]